MSKTMTSRLSNAVSHMSLWSLVAYLHPFKSWRFFHNFERKSDIFTNSMEYQKNMNIEWDETFDLGWLYEWLTRRWKAQNSCFSNKLFLGTIGYHICMYCGICTLHWYVFYSEIHMNKDNFRIVWVPLWYPKHFVLQTLMYKLSDAISNV